jgi:predicted NBD/HSP70 family sugar kinase
MLSLVADSRRVIGVDLAHDRFRGALVDLRGRITHTAEQPVPPRGGDAVVAALCDLLDTLERGAQAPIAGIGIGTPGLVVAQTGVVVNAVNLGGAACRCGVSSSALPRARLRAERQPAAALGEYTFGAPHAAAAAWWRSTSLRHRRGDHPGRRGFPRRRRRGGEIGHVVVREAARRAAAATWAAWRPWPARTPSWSARALARHAKVASCPAPERITFDAIEQAFTAGDPLARQVVLEAGRFMGTAISSLVGTLNIQRIALTGDITAGRRCSTRSWRRSRRRCCPAARGHPRGGRAARTQAIVLGASAVILQDYSLLFRRPASGPRAANL